MIIFIHYKEGSSKSKITNVTDNLNILDNKLVQLISTVKA